MKMLDVSDRVIWITDGMVSRIQQRDELKITVGTIDGHEV
jgi:putative ABC transport system ATP-binding protein